MHLWPSATIRDSFKLAYLRKLEWNLQRMKSEKESSASVNQKLLDSQEGEVNGKVAEVPNPKAHGVVLGLCREILMLLSCCFCCFCCGDSSSALMV
ncbi:hypothetical protein GBA52_007089 [Prunus armeniaca]|nr:hypothetical protein GBA52_007089 [Prunus armeniaca]